MLELIAKGSVTADHPAPLLFVHGAWHGAWCWDEHFLDYFAGRGYACFAPSLRGHGMSPGIERLRWTRIRDYVDDVAETAARLPAQPILIAHSMGGFVAQKYLERHSAAGVVLLAAVPPGGVLPTTLSIARHHPREFAKANLSMRLAPLVATPELARDLFFTTTTPDSDVRECQRRLQDESYRAFLDMLALDLVDTDRVERIPMLVLGAELDAIFPPARVHRTAAAYDTAAEILPGIGHDVMLEPGWEAVAGRIGKWLENQG
ncbi:lysophospholipase [Mycobacterium sp. Y57]|uniref:alpha/beta hydrolase n=1 Tax=Mycolicibacterium xanthum TaxID=2796469 RepID=UPI001C84CE47|nr:alpha/beta fold hydrolase [Mycolicibacterium xanthum]MBX7433994.1 lysophospholipase [Mycolicibacterium xanthum]